MKLSIFRPRKKSGKCQVCGVVRSSSRRLHCGHCCCVLCATAQHNTYTMAESLKQPGQPLAKHFPCPVCEEITILHTGGIQALDNPQSQISGCMATLQLGPTLIHNERATAGQRASSPAKLVWHYTGHRVIRDLAFLEGCRVAFITQDQKSVSQESTWVHEYTEVRVVDQAGRPTALPFPAAFTNPVRLASSIDGKTLAVTDSRAGRHSVIIYRQLKGLWSSQELSTSKSLVSIAVMSSNDVACSVGFDKVTRYQGGKVKWSKSVPGGGMMYVPYLAMYINGDVIVSNTNTNEVTVLNSEGLVQDRFPSRFLKWPTGVCLNSHGNVFVADQANDVVSMFTMRGAFIREVIQLDVQPLDIDLYQDRYMVVSTGDDGLLLYDLKPGHTGDI